MTLPLLALLAACGIELPGLSEEPDLMGKIHSAHITGVDLFADNEAQSIKDQEEHINERDHQAVTMSQGFLADDYLQDDEKQALIDLGIAAEEIDQYDWHFAWSKKYMGYIQPSAFGGYSFNERTKIIERIASFDVEEMDYATRYKLAQILEDGVFLKWRYVPDQACLALNLYTRLGVDGKIPDFIIETYESDYFHLHLDKHSYCKIIFHIIKYLETRADIESKQILLYWYNEFSPDFFSYNDSPLKNEAKLALINILNPEDIDILFNRNDQQKLSSPNGFFEDIIKSDKENAPELIRAFIHSKYTKDFLNQLIKTPRDDVADAIILVLETNEDMKANALAVQALEKTPHAVDSQKILALSTSLEDHIIFQTLLAKIGDEDSINYLIAIALSSDNTQKSLAFENLALYLHENKTEGIQENIPQEVYIAAQAALKTHKSPFMRLEALKLLVESENPQFADVLVAQLSDPDSNIGKTAIAALVSWGDKAVPALTKEIQNSTRPSVKTYVCYMILGKIGTDQAVQAIVDTAQQYNHDKTVNEALKNSGPKALKQVLARISDNPYPFSTYVASHYRKSLGEIISNIKSSRDEHTLLNSIKIAEMIFEANFNHIHSSKTIELGYALVDHIDNQNTPKPVVNAAAALLLKFYSGFVVRVIATSSNPERMAQLFSKQSLEDFRGTFIAKDEKTRRIIAQTYLAEMETKDWEDLVTFYDNNNDIYVNFTVLLIAAHSDHEKAIAIFNKTLTGEFDAHLQNIAVGALKQRGRFGVIDQFKPIVQDTYPSQYRVDKAILIGKLDPDALLELINYGDYETKKHAIAGAILLDSNNARILLDPNNRRYIDIKTAAEGILLLEEDERDKYIIEIIKAAQILRKTYPENALELLNLIRGHVPAHMETLIALGKLHYLNKSVQNIDAAKTLFLKIHEIDPHNPEITNYLGEISYNRGDFKQAVAYFEKALLTDPKNVDALINLATCYYYGRGVEITYKEGSSRGCGSPRQEIDTDKNYEKMKDLLDRIDPRNSTSEQKSLVFYWLGTYFETFDDLENKKFAYIFYNKRYLHSMSTSPISRLHYTDSEIISGEKIWEAKYRLQTDHDFK